MKKPWLDWNKRQFFVFGNVSALALGLAFFWGITFLPNLGLRVLAALVLVTLMAFDVYVLFSWAKEQDRRDPPWERQKRLHAEKKSRES